MAGTLRRSTTGNGCLTHSGFFRLWFFLFKVVLRVDVIMLEPNIVFLLEFFLWGNLDISATFTLSLLAEGEATFLDCNFLAMVNFTVILDSL